MADTRRWQGHPTCCPRQQDSVTYLSQHFVLELMPIAGGDRSFVQAQSLAITLAPFATSLIIPTTSNHSRTSRQWLFFYVVYWIYIDSVDDDAIASTHQ